MKDRHIRLTDENYYKIKENIEANKNSLNKEINELLKIGIDQKKLYEIIKSFENDILRIYKLLIYVKKLTEQIYANLDFDELLDPKDSESLTIFKKNNKKDLMND